MPSIRPDDGQTWRAPEDGDDVSCSNGGFEVFQDAPEVPEPPDPSTAQDRQERMDEDPESDNLNDELHMTDSSYFPEDVIEEDEDENDVTDVQEHRRQYAERHRRLEEFKQMNPDVLPDQLEIQFGHVQDVLQRLPNDVAVDSDIFRKELVNRGVSEALINQQMEDMAQFNAARYTSAGTPEPLSSPSAEDAADHSAWSATLPVRYTQQEQDRRAEQIHGPNSADQSVRGQNPVEDWETASIRRLGMPARESRVFIHLLRATVNDGTTEHVYTIERPAPVRADFDPTTSVLSIEVQLPVDPQTHWVYVGPEEEHSGQINQ